MTRCPNGHQVAADHKFCGECGAPLLTDDEMTDAELAADVKREMAAEKKAAGTSVSKGWLITIAVMVGVVIVGAVVGGDDDGGSDGPDDFGAFSICQEFVKDRLKAPSTAKFRNFFQEDGEVSVTGFGDGPYTVISSVDAENGFGAAIRNDFVCKVTYTGDDMWRLEDLAIN